MRKIGKQDAIVKVIKDNPTLHVEELAELAGCTNSYICTIASKHKLIYAKRRKWEARVKSTAVDWNEGFWNEKMMAYAF